MSAQDEQLPGDQHGHWQQTYRAHPGMYGQEPSAAAVHAAGVFRAAGARRVVELGAGHGRDALYLAGEGFHVTATDFSAVALAQLDEQARARDLTGMVETVEHDVRRGLPLPDAGADGVFAHMLMCMNLTTSEIRALVEEVERILRPGGRFVYTIRHIYDEAGLLPAERSLVGYRLYGQDALDRLGFIGAAKHLGLALEEISELLGVWQSGACFEVKAELHPRIEAILPAAALNLIRLDARLTGAPLANTRTSHFSQLAVTLAA